jgi:uncharacterized protein (TIGR00299 family) protein
VDGTRPGREENVALPTGPTLTRWFDGAVPRLLWIDASAGIAGDMLLGALVDLGVPLDAMQAAVDAVLPAAARLTRETVRRAGLRAEKVDVEMLEAAQAAPARTWLDIRRLLGAAALPDDVRALALRVFEGLALAEGRVHGVPAEHVHFHEVGAIDAIADVVGSCVGFARLDAAGVVLSPVALGAGTVRTAHGTLPVPVPAVLELARGWEVAAAAPDAGELATPTGLALGTAVAGTSGPLPAMTVLGTGVGAGSRDTPGRANVVRLVLGEAAAGGRPEGGPGVVLLETNVDDLDPRVWPDVLDRLLAAGALDAWLTPILMKKGRPAHTLHVLAPPDAEQALTDVVLTHTSTLGLRRIVAARHVLERAWVPVQVPGGQVRVKVGHRDGHVVHVTPEHDDALELSRRSGVPLAHVLTLAASAALDAGLAPGAAWPADPG